MSKHEPRVSSELKEYDNEIKTYFTTFGTKSTCNVLYEIFQILDNTEKIKVINLIKNK